MKTVLTMIAVFAVSTLAFAGQENRGGAYYGPEIARCSGDTLEISVHHNEGDGDFAALVSRGAGGQVTPFGVSETLPRPGAMGGGRTYSAPGFDLSICTDCWSPQGIPGSARISSMGIDQSVHCSLD